MSKEKLDFDVEKEMKHLKKISNKDDSLTISSRFVKYLIEQTERVKELEENLEHGAKVAVKTAEKLHYEQQQNKRYRDLLTSRIVKQLIRLEDKGCFLPDEDREDFLNLKYTVEALEGEE